MLLRRIARPLLAGIFIYGGINELRDLKSHAHLAEPVVDTIVDLAPVDRSPATTTVLKLDAGIKIGAGALLALGKFPRVAATALAAGLIPTTLAGHRFWETDDPQERTEQLVHFLKNLGLLGGLMIAAADTAGKPSLAWRGRRARRLAAAASQRKLAEITAATDRASGKVSGLTAGTAGKASRWTAETVGTATKRGRMFAGRAARLGEEAAGKAAALSQEAAGRATALGYEAAGKAAALGQEAAGRTAALGHEAAGRATALGHEAAGRATAMGHEAAGAFADATGEVKGRLKRITR